MNTSRICTCAVLVLTGLAQAAEPLTQEPNTWVKRSPLKDGPTSPGMGYEAALGYDPRHRVVIRWGGHNQGGGGEQNAETWVYDPVTTKWTLKEPNTSPPGVCCAQQNVFDVVGNRYLRFPAFSGSHGWQWFREIYLNNSTVWSYDLATNTWRDMRPVPAPRVSPLRCASWDSDHQVVVIFGGEGNPEGTVVYDPYANTWTKMNPPAKPDFRSGGNMAYDAARKLHILFGAQFQEDAHTWAYDLARNQWRDMQPATQPPTNRNDAVLAYDSVNQVVIAVVRAADKLAKDEVVEGHLETWAYDAGKNTWTKMNPPREPDGKNNRRRIMVAVPDQNLILMENYANPTDRIPGVDREQQMWTYRYAEPKADSRPLPPAEVTLRTTDKSAILSWKASPSANVTGYRIYRGEGLAHTIFETPVRPSGFAGQPEPVVGSPHPGSFKYQQVAEVEERTSFTDEGLERRFQLYSYFVRAVADGRESADSLKVWTQPPLVEDVVVRVRDRDRVELSWKAAPGEDIIGYHVERAPVEVFSEDEIVRLKKDTTPLAEPSVGAIKHIGLFERIYAPLAKATTFVDSDVTLTPPAKGLRLKQPTTEKEGAAFAHRFAANQLDDTAKQYRHAVYAYRVRAVNSQGLRGGPSPYVLTIPSAPQWLFSREDGESCHLKWTANPEQKLKGYRVYRIDGPRINGPGQTATRLTAEPISETRFTDTRAGPNAQRYHVVAVDALGQEGFPSAPTWHYREYRRYYVPFVGEWHQ